MCSIIQTARMSIIVKWYPQILLVNDIIRSASDMSFFKYVAKNIPVDFRIQLSLYVHKLDQIQYQIAYIVCTGTMAFMCRNFKSADQSCIRMYFLTMRYRR
jgi:hypothetical protein